MVQILHNTSDENVMASNTQLLEINKCLNCNNIYDYTDCAVETLQGEIDYSQFYEKYIYKNLPCVIRNVGSRWECTNKWVIGDSINCDYFMNTYRDLDAPVADCDSVTYNSQSKSNLKVSDFFTYLISQRNGKLLYLKDWHLRRLCPDDKFYEVPSIFGADWLNEYAQDHQEDDFMFVYIGPKDSWTPLHADVYNSFSWSVNVVGRKKWILFPPGEEEKLKDSFGNLPLLFKENNFGKMKYFEIIQEKAEAIFIPSGWHHQVTNLLDTISINHNWINACNIEEVWRALENCLLSVEQEIEEFKDSPDYADQCQLILKSMFGMDFEYYINLICYIAKKRLGQLQGENLIGFDKYSLGKHHIIFDLKKILKVIDLFNNHPLIVKDSIQLNCKYDYTAITQSIKNCLFKFNE